MHALRSTITGRGGNVEALTRPAGGRRLSGPRSAVLIQRCVFVGPLQEWRDRLTVFNVYEAICYSTGQLPEHRAVAMGMRRT